MRSGAFALVFDKERGAGRRRGFAWARCAPKVASALPTPGRIAGQDGYVAGCPCRQPMVAIWSQNEKEATPRAWYNLLISCGRSDWIRTSDPLLPKQVRYQTAPRSAAVAIGQSAGLGKPGLLRPVRRKQRKTPRKRLGHLGHNQVLYQLSYFRRAKTSYSRKAKSWQANFSCLLHLDFF